MAYQFVRPLAFRLAPSQQTVPHSCSVLAFPGELKRLLRDELSRATERPSEQVRLPITSLNKTIRMLVPSITSITPRADLEEKEMWLYSHETSPVSPRALRLILDAWIMTTFTALEQEERERLTSTMATIPLEWQIHDSNLAEWEQNSEGTAVFLQQTELNGFLLLSDLVAAQLTAQQTVLTWEDEPLHFRRVPAYGKDIELISWPPLHYYENEQRRWPYSVLITLSAQTVPFQAFPQLNCNVGIRRWAGPRVSSFPLKEDTSIYLADHVPWVTSKSQSRSFQVAPASWERIPEPERVGKETNRLVWRNTLVPLLNALHITEQERLPSPEAIRQAPEEYISYQGLPSAAIVYRNGIQPDHEVGTGLMPVDRYLFMEELKKQVAPLLEPLPLYQRREIKLVVPDNLFSPPTEEKKKEEVLVQFRAQRRTLVARQCGNVLAIEIWYQSQRIRLELLQALQRLLGGEFPIDAGDQFTVPTQELLFVVSLHPLGELGAILPLSTEKKEKRQERIREAIRQRVRTIEKSLPERLERVLAFIELDDDTAFPEGRDPKSALRKGFALRQRLTHFLTPYIERNYWSEKRRKDEQEALKHRVESTILDGLRELGVLGTPLRLSVATTKEDVQLPLNIHYIGLWLIKKFQATSATHVAQQVPVLVHMDAESEEVLVMAPGFQDWLSYADAQLTLAQDGYVGFQKKEEVKEYILEALDRYLPEFDHTLLFCHAQNLQGTWEWLTNGKMTKKLPEFLEAYEGLRIIRVRNGSLETPQWYAESDEEAYAGTQGVFQMGDSGHVFASIQGKPPTATISKSASKMRPRQGQDKNKQPKIFPPDPTQSAWNASIGEMTFVGSDAREAALYAKVADQLRHGFMVQYEYGLSLPFPLHLAKQLEAYVLPTNSIIQQLLEEESE